jgi:membrane protease YdiL (CAAX protease family)
MSKKKLQTIFVDVFHEAGLMKWSPCYRDTHFLAAIITGVVVLWFIHDHVPVLTSGLTLQWPLLISILLWQPFVEEVLFRGVIQGQLSRYKWAQSLIFKLTVANIVASILFVAMHIIGNPVLWSLAIFIPSLLFGYFRDRYHSVYPSMLLHSAYNAMVVIGLLVHH